MTDHIVRIALAIAVTNALLCINAAAVSGAPPTLPDEPRVLRAVAPGYPVVAMAAGASGPVIVEAQVDVRGVVTSVRAIEGHKLLWAVTENSARRWLFEPAKKQTGVRVVRLKFVFKIMPKGTPADQLLPVFMPPYYLEVKEAIPNLDLRGASARLGHVAPPRLPEKKPVKSAVVSFDEVKNSAQAERWTGGACRQW